LHLQLVCAALHVRRHGNVELFWVRELESGHALDESRLVEREARIEQLLVADARRVAMLVLQ
jgi:hypothetical protein